MQIGACRYLPRRDTRSQTRPGSPGDGIHSPYTGRRIRVFRL